MTMTMMIMMMMMSLLFSLLSPGTRAKNYALLPIVGYASEIGCFWDSDVGKWIEAVCYFLQHNADASGPSTRALDDLESSVHELVDQIRKAQQPDGYLNIHYTVVEPDKRWTYLSDTHEL